MSRQRDQLVNFERVWREMDELLGDPIRSQTAFAPRVDVYYCGDPQAKAIVKVELAGVDIDTVSLEVSGRELVVTGERPVAETEGRVYQQVEIEAGPFRRVIALGADVIAEQAKASYEDGILRIELPLAGQVTTRVPIQEP
jgi:HSP20 family protein